MDLTVGYLVPHPLSISTNGGERRVAMMSSDLMLTLARDRHRDLMAQAAEHRLVASRRRPRRWLKRSAMN